ncbi:MAG TPA: cytochrome P450 [Pseudonocardiaceae bacterium]|nr:cytochrome P450 [Pseudonocardiaceae bacterium]
MTTTIGPTGPAGSTLPPRLIDGLRWDGERDRLMVCDPRLAALVLKDPHIATGIDHGRAGTPVRAAAPGTTPSVVEFFAMWYTVTDDYARFNTELRKAFTTRAVEAFDGAFADLAARHAATMPAAGDLTAEFLSPYFLNSTFTLIGVPEPAWPNLTKVSRLVIHLFKQELLGVSEHSPEQLRAFATVMRYLESLAGELLAGDGDTPFLAAARRLCPDAGPGTNTWPIAALVGQLLLAGIEPMIVAAASAIRSLWADPDLLVSLRRAADGAAVDAGRIGDIAEEVLRQHPPFAHIFRFVTEPCTCLGTRLDAGTVVAIDIAAVNLALAPAHRVGGGCPVGPSAVLTFGKGLHFCLGANSARRQVAAALRQLVSPELGLRIDPDAVRIRTQNNLSEVLALPYSTGGDQ